MPHSPPTSVSSNKGCRAVAFVLSVAGAVVWNLGLLYVFEALLGGSGSWTLVDWLVLAALMPFAAAGAGLVGLAVYFGVPLLNPRVTLEIYPSRSGPGDRVELAWRIEGDAERIRVLNLHLEGREEVTVTTPTGTGTVQEVFRRLPVLRTSEPDRIRSGGAAFRLPADTVPSFGGRRGRLAWYFCIQSGVGRWPHIRQEVEYPVIPTTPPAAPE